jgi:hypothetical protein
LSTVHITKAAPQAHSKSKGIAFVRYRSPNVAHNKLVHEFLL